jgi:hypothetical protein
MTKEFRVEALHSTRRNAVRNAIRPALVALVLLSPTVLLVWTHVRFEDRIAELDPPAVAVTAPLVPSQDSRRQNVQLTVVLSDPRPVVSPPGAAGTVTAVLVKPGDTIQTGTPVLAIDGTVRDAIASPAPFYREIAVGTTGDDVLALERFLRDRSYGAGAPNTTFDRADSEALKKLQAVAGATQTGVFTPDQLVWLPAPAVTVGPIEVKVGAPTPAPGSTLLETTSTVTATAVRGTDGRVPQLTGAWVLTLAGHDYALQDGQLGDADRAALGLQLADPTVQKGQDGSYAAAVALRTPASVVRVPASAVVTTPTGTTCIYLVGARTEPIDVEIVGGIASSVEIARPTAEAGDVLVNPGQILGAGATCRSR